MNQLVGQAGTPGQELEAAAWLDSAQLFAEGGSVRVNGLSIQQMRSAWDSSSAPVE